MENLICKCQICKKGNIIELENNFVCDYAKSVDDKCGFNLFKDFMGVEITSDLVIELMKNGKTKQLTLTKKDKSQFVAALKLNGENDFHISLDFEQETLPLPCPKCGRKIKVSTNAYSCEGYRDNESCNFYIKREIASIKIPLNDILHLLKTNETKEFYEFEGRKKYFLAKLIIDKEFNTAFKSEICSCPKCKDGKIIGVGKVYMCNNECGFFIYRNFRFKEITVNNLITISIGQIAILKGINKKDNSGKYDANLKLSDDFKLVTI